MTDFTFSRDNFLLDMSLYQGDVFSDGPYRDVLKAGNLAAWRDGALDDSDVTKRTLDATLALDAAGLWSNLIFWFAPDRSLRGTDGKATKLYDLGPNNIGLTATAPIGLTAVGTPPRSVFDLVAATSGLFTGNVPAFLLDGKPGLTLMAAMNIKPASAVSKTYLSMSSNTGAVIQLIVSASNQIQAGSRSIYNGTITSLTGTSSPGADSWFTYESVLDAVAGSLSLYNGANSVVSPASVTPSASGLSMVGSFPLSLGMAGGATGIGQHSDIMLFNKPLSTSERTTVRGILKGINPQLP
jgi:hypothetical protein